MTIVRIAVLTINEMVRRRLVATVVVLTVVVALLTGWGFHALATETRGGQPLTHLQVITISATLLLLVAYAFNLVFALGGAFVAAPALASDIESGLLLPIVARPLRRSDVVIGKFLGLALLLSCYAFIAGFLEFAIVRSATGYWPPHPAIAMLYLSGVAITMISLALLLGSRLSAIASGVAAVVLYGIGWICGIVGDIGAQYHKQNLVNAGTISQLLLPTDAFWRSSVYRLEPAVMIATMHGSAPFAVATPPPAAMTYWGIGWIVLMVSLACWSLTTRDL
jgi:ABC-type transport system involved in multi-copper enzyme maturation permease subunit